MCFLFDSVRPPILSLPRRSERSSLMTVLYHPSSFHCREMVGPDVCDTGLLDFFMYEVMFAGYVDEVTGTSYSNALILFEFL